jgi:EAL domain-containing protein (putative c-di-GMP-specific phosphodiesterase class I)
MDKNSTRAEGTPQVSRIGDHEMTARPNSAAADGCRRRDVDLRVLAAEYDSKKLSLELRDALADGAIVAHYQPIVWLDDGRLDGIEVLARLRDKYLGSISPEIFVPILEQAGLAEQLMQAVLVSGLPEIAAFPYRVPAAFNLPLEMILRPDVLGHLEHQRDVLGLGTEDVSVELTESRPVADLSALGRALDRWTTCGYRIAIDDVTPAMPHHRALLDLPFHAAKLDRTVTRESATGQAMVDFLADFVAAAQSRGKYVIAEGIESAEDWTRMRDAGVDLGQGFLISPALPLIAMTAWMQRPSMRRPYAQIA